MKAALVMDWRLPSPQDQLARMVASTKDAARNGVDFVLFPEASVTGLICSNDPEHDLPLGQPIPGPLTKALGGVAKEHGVWVAAGVLEREGDSLYDSAVLLGPDGCVAFRYRRIQPQWHGRKADPLVYRRGTDLSTAETPFGKMAFLICGDLFDDEVVGRLRALDPDYVSVPFSRSFTDCSFDQAKWVTEEEPEYAGRAALLRSSVLMVNQLEDPKVSKWPAFGGAMVVSADGEIICRWPLAKAGICYVDV